MRLSTLLFCLPLAEAARRGSRIGARDTNNTALPEEKQYIIEAEKSTSLDDLVRKVEANGVRVAKRYDTDIFTGLSVVTGHDNVDSLQEVSEVSRAWAVNTYQVSPREQVASFSSNATEANYSVHWATGVDRAHAAGIYGKGVRIAVLDTGIDYTHPALGGGFGPGFKVAGGYDLVGENFTTELGVKTPDSDPADDDGHGTHVAGIIAGKTDSFIGVAPEATLLAYKVFGAAGSTNDATLIEATLMAYEAGVDIITASIGRVSGFSSGPWAEVCSRVVSQGVVVTVSAGNDGEVGPFYASSGSSGKNVLSVASVETGILPTHPWHAIFTYQNQTNVTQLGYVPGNNWPLWNITGYPIVAVEFDNADSDSCAPVEGTPDLANKIALVYVNDCPGSANTATVLARTKNAHWVIVYSDSRAPYAINIYDTVGPQRIMIDNAAGLALIAALKAGVNVTADFSVPADDSWSIGVQTGGGGLPSTWSSWGGTNELELKPDIAAPGSSIWSTARGGAFEVRSGTSMSTPYVAGVAALYIGQFGGRAQHGVGFAKQLADRIVSSGQSVPWQVLNPNYDFAAPVVQVGGGLINATKVLTYQTALQFERFALNDTNNFQRYHKVDITNNGDTEVAYTFDLEAAGGFHAQGRTASILGDVLDTSPFSLVPTVSFPTGRFVVAPGQTKTAQFNFLYPAVDDVSLLPIYSGKVRIHGSNGEELGVPYFGAAFDLKVAVRGQLFPSGFPYLDAGPQYLGIDAYHSFAFNVSLAALDYPRVYYQTMWGVKEVRWDIYDTSYRESDWSYPPVVGEHGYVGSATTSAYTAYEWQFDPATMDRNKTLPFPLTDVPRGDSWNQAYQEVWWMGMLANGSYIAPGNYTMRFAAQLPFSNPAHSDNWQIWKTPTIEVRPIEF